MKQQLITMLELQDAMNSKVNPEWRSQGNEWYRAIWVECAELMDHYGWKWWKSQQPDLEQVELELIDIWHFGISIALEKAQTHHYSELAAQLEQELVFEKTESDFRVAIEAFALKTLSTKRFDVKGFASLMTLSGLSFEGLFRSYVAKNVLNIFRQDNGYKEGSYIKVWQGKEDNEHLMEILSTMQADQFSMKALYDQLQARYSETAPN